MKLNESTISTLLGILVVIVVGVLIFNYFKKVGKETPELEELPAEITEVQEVPKEGQVPEGLPKEYTVKTGDNLWMIAENYFGSGYNWVDIAKANELVNPNFLLADQKLKIPQAEAKTPTKTLASDSEPITEGKYTVQEGDNLWMVAVRAYGDGYQWPKLAQENNLADANHIEPDQVLVIPR